MRLVTASLCAGPLERINAFSRDPMALRASWTHRAYDGEAGQWGPSGPTYNNVYTSTKASTFGLAQVLAPPVTKVEFTITLTSTQGSVTQIVTGST